MSKDDIKLDDDFIDDDIDTSDDDSEAAAEDSNAGLTKRRIIDNLLEERRLNKELSDYEYDLDD